MRNRLTRRAALTSAAAALTVSRLSPTASAQSAAWRRIDIASAPIPRFSRPRDETRFGRLSFRGGLILTSPDKDFGGLSGLALEPNGRTFVAVTDEGSWLTGDIVERDGRPSAIDGVRLGEILGADGISYRRKRDKDCEAITLIDGDLTRGMLLMAFERNHRIERFPVIDRVVQPSIGALAPVRDAQRMEANKGLEVMTVLRGGALKGAVVAFSERLLDADGHHTGWLWNAGAPQRIGVTVIDGFDLTDAVGLPDGSLVLLERRFRWTEGVQMRLRLISAAEIAPGRIAEGQVLLGADNAYEIDNMEGLAAHQDADGTTILTLVSDNNFSPVLQRTLLLRFALSA